MVDICFGVSREHLDYATVTMASIVKYTDTKKSLKDFSIEGEEGYHFHIFSENCDEKTQEYLQDFIKELCKTYYCTISVHIVSEKDFEECSRVPWSNHAAMFYKIQAARILKDLDKCLFLGSDTLCLQDIRELFALNLKDYIVAAAWDAHNHHGYIRKAKAKQSGKADLVFEQAEYYFNNDVMLFNLEQWRKQNIEQKCMYYLQNYHLEGVLDVFPLATAPQILLISNKYNLFVGHFTREQIALENTYLDESSTPIWNFTRKEFEHILKDLKIVQFCHYECYKPWQSKYQFLTQDFNLVSYPYYDLWWEIALNTPVIKKTFEKLRDKLEKNKLDIYNKALRQRLLETKSQHDITYQICDSSAVKRVKNQLSYKIGKTILEAKNLYKIIILPFSLFFVVLQYKKSQKVYKLIRKVVNIPPLEQCADYNDALKIKGQLSYKIGSAFIKNPLSFIFKFKGIYKAWKTDNEKRS